MIRIDKNGVVVLQYTSGMIIVAHTPKWMLSLLKEWSTTWKKTPQIREIKQFLINVDLGLEYTEYSTIRTKIPYCKQFKVLLIDRVNLFSHITTRVGKCIIESRFSMN